MRLAYCGRVPSRYIASRARGVTPMLWRVRARLEDTETGETIELRSEESARKLGELLARIDSNDLPAVPSDASPLARYQSVENKDGWHYLWRGEGALDDDSFARTKSEGFAQRVVDTLNRADPRLLSDYSGPVNAGWF